MKSVVLAFIFSCLVILSAGLYAQEPQKTAPDQMVKVSGHVFAEYAWYNGYQPGKEWNQAPDGDATYRAISPNSNNTFNLTRIYLNFRKSFTDTLSARVTTDAQGGTSTPFTLYLKFAFIQYQESFYDFLTVQFQAGMIGTPITGTMDGISDCRWIYNDLYDKSANLLRGQGFDSTADLGLRLSLTFLDMITLTGAYVNGEGFKKVDETNNFDGKAYYAVVTVRPVPSLYMNGFFRYENDAADNTATSCGVSSEVLYGFGAAWSSDLINVGAHAFFLWNNDKTNPTRRRKSYFLTETYFLFNLGELVPWFPLIVHGRYGFGIEYASDVANGGKNYITHMYACGLGWRFSENLRVLVYYEAYRYHMSRDPGYQIPDDANNLMVKSEIKI